MEEDQDSVSDDSHSQPSERQMSPRKAVKNEVKFWQIFSKFSKFQSWKFVQIYSMKIQML